MLLFIDKNRILKPTTTALFNDFRPIIDTTSKMFFHMWTSKWTKCESVFSFLYILFRIWKFWNSRTWGGWRFIVYIDPIHVKTVTDWVDGRKFTLQLMMFNIIVGSCENIWKHLRPVAEISVRILIDLSVVYIYKLVFKLITPFYSILKFFVWLQSGYPISRFAACMKETYNARQSSVKEKCSK